MRGNTGKQKAGIKAPNFDGTQPCLKEDLDMFFPDYIRGDKEHNKQEKRKETMAKKICLSCPFISDCLEYALVEGMDGIWGATNPLERRRIRQRRRMPPPPDISKFIDSIL